MQGFYPAQVIDNNDTEKLGRIKIKVEHLHYGFSNDMLPWAMQSSLSTGGSDLFGSSSIPETDSFVWVWFEDVDTMLRQPYYICDLQFTGKQPHNLFESNVKSTLESSATYPNAKYTYYKNGICIGVDSSSDNAEIFIYHPQAFIFINKNGELTLKAGTTTVEKSVLGETLQTLLSDLLDKIIIHAHPTAVGPTLAPNNAADFTLLKTINLPKILSPKIKNN